MVIFIRGLPGSGKTTLANKIASKENYTILEADMWFEDDEGNYNFDPKELGKAHEWCYKSFKELLKQGNRNVIVSNTFVHLWEIDNYISFCEEMKIEYKIFKTIGNYGSIHDVPENTIEKMKTQWEEIEGEIIYE